MLKELGRDFGEFLLFWEKIEFFETDSYKIRFLKVTAKTKMALTIFIGELP